jgi:hypothetical protein
MDPAVKSAIDRLLRKFAARHKGVLTAASLLRFGIKLDVPPPPAPAAGRDGPTAPRAGGWVAPPPIQAQRVVSLGGEEGYRNFRMLAADVCEAVGGSRQWSYANDPGTLRRILDDMAATLEGFMISTADAGRRSRFEGLIGRVRQLRDLVS